MELCQTMDCGRTKDECVNKTDDDWVNFGDLCPEVWALIQERALDLLYDPRQKDPDERHMLVVISEIGNGRDYINACEEEVLPLCDCAEVGERCTEDDEEDPFYQVLDAVADEVLSGIPYKFKE